MKILFSPSETKFPGGYKQTLCANNFSFSTLYNYTKEAIDTYEAYIQNASYEQLCQLFGTKKADVVKYYSQSLYEKPLMKAIERYDGVAYDYLNYKTLNLTQQNYLDDNVIIFSNLFGPIFAKTPIPEYKLKQGEKLGSLALEKFYNEHFTQALDTLLHDEEIIDLRAGFYEKFYKITQPYITMKFIKQGKVVSHWAKAYRGIILRLLAQNSIQTIDELMNMQIENLSIKEIKKQKNKTEIVYDILAS
jgi:cytoplasmic iron level regulating protein YaaA (DUF328/UPF0246 family)